MSHPVTRADRITVQAVARCQPEVGVSIAVFIAVFIAVSVHLDLRRAG